jgi:hypothetical protein
MSKTLTKTKKETKPEKIDTAPSATVALLGTPQLVLQRATDKGVSCVVRNARLTWVFVKEFREDKTDWRKGTKSVTILVPKKGAQGFQRQLADAIKQAIALNKKVVDSAEKMQIFKTATAIDVEGSLLKDGGRPNSRGEVRAELADCLTWQVKKSAMRENKNDAFTEKYPIALQDATGRAVEPHFIEREFYSGVYADVALTLSVYEVNGNAGVTAYLNGLRKVRDGERIGGFDPFAGIEPAAADESADINPDLIW